MEKSIIDLGKNGNEMKTDKGIKKRDEKTRKFRLSTPEETRH